VALRDHPMMANVRSEDADACESLFNITNNLGDDLEERIRRAEAATLGYGWPPEIRASAVGYLVGVPPHALPGRLHDDAHVWSRIAARIQLGAEWVSVACRAFFTEVPQVIG
jgi:hypothetical protein